MTVALCVEYIRIRDINAIHVAVQQSSQGFGAPHKNPQCGFPRHIEHLAADLMRRDAVSSAVGQLLCAKSSPINTG
ncbi:hypothetical protein [Rhodomicrobium udaipurense]|uniref:Uncharacterized protein n=1 Tax=Rhodomicrobium udaipurense TaxID=1202716 RepID=A0A8I1GFV6_9HYPH|nr:hypothetical protein [Rhodomicrobium udaipurense]MBJ7544324.1 hypothetical protein [Rhodomicrobium udaipurense]